MPTKTSVELAAWKCELHQALTSAVPIPEVIVKEMIAHFNQTDSAMVFPRPTSSSAHVLVAQLSNAKPLGFSTAAGTNVSPSAVVAGTALTASSTPDQTVIDTTVLLTSLFVECRFGSDLLSRIALPIVNQTALNLCSYLVATLPTTTEPNTQDEEAVFSANPFAQGNRSRNFASSFLSAGYSSIARSNHVYHSNPRLAAAQTLMALTRRFQLSASTAKEVTACVEKHIMGYLSLCQAFGNCANVDNGKTRVLKNGTSNNNNNNFAAGGPSAALTTFMTIQHNVTHLVILSFTNAYNSWGNLFSAGSGAAATSSPNYEPNALIANQSFGNDAKTWISALMTKITDSANQHIDAISSSLAGGGAGSSSAAASAENTAAQDRARAAIVQYVDGFVSVVVLIVGLFRIAQQDIDRGMDFIIDAFRGDRREINAPDARSTDLKVFLFRGKVAKRLVAFCPPSARLRLPNWFIPEIYFDLLKTVTSDAVLPALKHLSDLDVESCRIYNAALEEVASLRQQQAVYQQNLASQDPFMAGIRGAGPSGSAQILGGTTTYIGRTGSALTGAPASTAIVTAPTVACYPYTSVMASVCDCIAFVFTVLPGRYLREEVDGVVDTDFLDVTSGNAIADPEMFAANDNNIATFVFRNFIYHLKDLYEVSGKSGIDTYAAAASSALGIGGGAVGGLLGGSEANSAIASGLWDVFALKASAAYSNLLAKLGGLDERVSTRIFATVLGEGQADCSELQWTNLLRQVRLALNVAPSATSGGNQQQTNSSLGGGGLLGSSSSDPFRFNEQRNASAAANLAPIPQLSPAVMQQASSHTLVAVQQLFATNALTMIANIATISRKSVGSGGIALIARAIPAEAVLSLLDSALLSPEALGAILSATSALMTTAEQRRHCWAMLEQKGLLRVSNAPAASTAASSMPLGAAANGSGWAPSSIVTDSEINSLPGHCLRENRVGSYPITAAFLRLLLTFIEIPSVAASPSAGKGGNVSAAQDFLSGGSATTVSVPSADATAILNTPTFRGLLKFVSDDVVCALGRRSYGACEDELYELTALSSELLHDALVTFGPNVPQLSGADATSSPSIVIQKASSAASSSPTATSALTLSSSPYAAFHTLLATARAPNDVLTQILTLINEAVADIQAEQPISVVRMSALRVTLKLLYSAMHSIKCDRRLSDAVYTFNARTYDNTEFVVSIIRLCCGCAQDDQLARRCFAILGLIDSIVMSTTVRMILAPSSSHGDLRNTARYLLASVIDDASSSVAPASGAASDAFGLPCHLQRLDRDHLANADVPSTASALLDLLNANVHFGIPSLTSWLCGYAVDGTNGNTITWEGSCLEVIVAKVNDANFRHNPAAAPLATKCIRLIYGLMCNPTTATNQFHSILTARGNHSFLRAVHHVATGSASEALMENDELAFGANNNTQGISLYDTVSTEKHSITLHLLDFAGYAFRILSIHLHRLSQKSAAEERASEIARRGEHEVNGLTLRSTQLLAAGQSNGRFTNDAVRVGGTSVMATSHDPLVIQLRKMIRLFGNTSGSASAAFSARVGGRHTGNSYGIVDSDLSDEDSDDRNAGGFASSAQPVSHASYEGSAMAFGRRMLEVIERLPAYPVLSVPGGATDAFVVQTNSRIPQYSIPALSVAFAQYAGANSSLDEIRENLRIFVFANSCLIAYNAAANYIRGWCELLEVVCVNTNANELSLEKLMTLADEIVAAITISDKFTIAAQQEIVITLSQALCSVTAKMSEARAATMGNSAEAERAWAEEGSHSLQSLLTAVIRALVRFRDVAAPSRLNLYNVVRLLLALAPLQVEPYMSAEDRECVMEVIVGDICNVNTASLSDAALGGYLTPDTSSELVALHCLRRFLQLPETLAYFAISARSTVSAANTLSTSTAANATASMSAAANTSAASAPSVLVGASDKDAESFWAPSAKLVSVVKAIFRTIDAACCALFSGGANVFGQAAFVLEYVESAADILALIAQSCPHVLYNAGAVEVAFQMRCWELVNRALNDQGSVAVLTARHYADTTASCSSSNGWGANVAGCLPPHVIRLFADVGARILTSTLSWTNALFEEKSMRQHLGLVAACADFMRSHLALFQCVCKGSNYGAKNAAVIAHAQQQQLLRRANSGGAAGIVGSGANGVLFGNAGAGMADQPTMDGITPIHTSQLKLAEEVSLLLSVLAGSHIATECRSLIQLLGITDLLLSFTAPEMLTQPFFVDEEAEAAQMASAAAPTATAGGASPYVQVPISTVTYSQIGHVARTTRNLSAFLLSTVHPLIVRMKQQETEAVAKIPSISAQLASAQSTLLPRFSQTVDPSKTGLSTTSASTEAGSQGAAQQKPRLAASPDDVWPLLEAAFMTSIGVLLQQLTFAVSTTIEWEVKSAAGGHLNKSNNAWHSKPYLEAITSLTLLAHSAVLQSLLMKKDEPHLFSASSTDSYAKALSFHVRHLAAALNSTLLRLADVQTFVLNAASGGNSGGVSDGGARSSLVDGDVTATLADALDQLNGTSSRTNIINTNNNSAINRSILTGGAAYDGRAESAATVGGVAKKPSLISMQLGHAGTTRIYQSVQKVRSLVLAACRDAEKLFEGAQ